MVKQVHFKMFKTRTAVIWGVDMDCGLVSFWLENFSFRSVADEKTFVNFSGRWNLLLLLLFFLLLIYFKIRRTLNIKFHVISIVWVNVHSNQHFIVSGIQPRISHETELKALPWFFRLLSFTWHKVWPSLHVIQSESEMSIGQ